MDLTVILQVLMAFILCPRPSWAETCPPNPLAEEICCGELGCYNRSQPFCLFPLPCCQDWDEVEFRLYKSDKQYSKIRIDQQLPTSFQTGARTVMITHGWMGSADDTKGPITWIPDLLDAFLTKYPQYNIIFLDWSAGAGSLDYLLAASNVRVVGAMVGRLAAWLVDTGAVTSWDDLWLLGFSLGAHVMGHAGRWTDGRVGRITGLEAAGPLFELSPLEAGLNPTCAQLVDAIHTDTIFSGTRRAIGHVDFYVNGVDELQPGCFDEAVSKLTLRGSKEIPYFDPYNFNYCNHRRVNHVLADAIRNDQCFLTTANCSHVIRMPASCEECSPGACPELGPATEDNPVPGIYYLETNPDFPPHCTEDQSSIFSLLDLITKWFG